MIPVISLWQPWASLVALGEKNIETRFWKWPRGLPDFLAIHASKKWNRDLARFLHQEPFRAALALHGHEEKVGAKNGNLPFGAIIGVVRIVECVSTSLLPEDQRFFAGLSIVEMYSLAAKYLREFKNERAFGDYSFGRYAWVFDRHLAIKPIPTSGNQGIWDWEPTQEIKDWIKEKTP